MADQPIHDTKTCTKCMTTKPATAAFFGSTTKAKCGLRPQCKICTNAAERIRRDANPDEGRARGAAWYAANKERRLRLAADYYAANKERIEAKRQARIAANPEAAKKRWRDWAKARYDTDHNHRINSCISPAVRRTLKNGKGGKGWQEIVGYSVRDLTVHLERQFARGMSWGNYGKVWEIDHIRPVASYDFARGDDEVRACWALSNLRPLCVKANRSKGKKILLLA